MRRYKYLFNQKVRKHFCRNTSQNIRLASQHLLFNSFFGVANIWMLLDIDDLSLVLIIHNIFSFKKY